LLSKFVIPLYQVSGTEAAFGRKRRLDVEDALGAMSEQPTQGSTKRRALQLGKSALTESILKEATFLAAKKQKSKLTAINDNHVLPANVSDGDHALAGMLKTRQAVLDVTRERAELRRRKILSKPSIANLHRLSCFLGAGLRPGDFHDSFTEHSLRTETDITEASLFVVSNPSDPGHRISWLVALRGGRLATPTYLLSNGRTGSCITYECAVKTRRKLWMSPAFVTAHPQLAGIIAKMTRLPCSRWTLLSTEAQFIKRVAQSIKSNRHHATMAVVTRADKRARPVFKHIRSVMLGQHFLKFIARVDRMASATGMCDS
jgi:hypothetical protein